MKLVVFGLSLSSSWGNGHATTYRALLRAFSARGHEIAFYEWNAPWYAGPHRDLLDPGFCRLVLYPTWNQVQDRGLGEAREADAVLVGSYVREGPRLIDALAAAGARLHFYDIDTPVTVAQLRRGKAMSLRRDQVPLFERYFSFTGGPFLSEVLERELGARSAHALYCAVDPDRHAPTTPDPRLKSDLAYMGTYAHDRQAALERLLVRPARRLARSKFLVAGPQYPAGLRWPPNVRRLAHVAPRRHSAFYSSSAWQLNLTRTEMVRAGWSPSVRLFEAAACGAAILSDSWRGIGDFLAPGREILLPESGEEVVEILSGTHPDDRRALGAAARARVLAEHTADRRAEQLEALLAPGRKTIRSAPLRPLSADGARRRTGVVPAASGQVGGRGGGFAATGAALSGGDPTERSR